MPDFIQEGCGGGGLISHVQYKYHHCGSFLIEEISHAATVHTLLLKLRSLAEIINNYPTLFQHALFHGCK